MAMHLKNIHLTRPRLLWALAGLAMMMIYLATYGVLRHRGDMVVVEEGNTRKTFVYVRIDQSKSLNGQFCEAMLSGSKADMEKFAKKAKARENLLQVFAPAMSLEGFIRELQVNLTRDIDA